MSDCDCAHDPIGCLQKMFVEKIERAIEDFDMSIKLNPRDADPYANRAAMRRSQSDQRSRNAPVTRPPMWAALSVLLENPPKTRLYPAKARIERNVPETTVPGAENSPRR